jgi:hypothetical protein
VCKCMYVCVYVYVCVKLLSTASVRLHALQPREPDIMTYRCVYVDVCVCQASSYCHFKAACSTATLAACVVQSCYHSV